MKEPLYYTFANHTHWVDLQWSWREGALADSIGDMLALVEATGARDRGVKNRKLWVTRNTVAPAILVECGFLSNDTERRNYGGRAYRTKVVVAIADGIEEFLEIARASELEGIEFEDRG